MKERLKLDNEYKLKFNFSSLLRYHLKNKNKAKTFDIVGYSVKDLKQHLESKFQDGMSWDNYGLWHIDHIKPASLFKYNYYTDPEFLDCWNLNNLQPLWAKDNILKSNKYFIDPIKKVTI